MYHSRAMPSQTALTRELLIIIIHCSNYLTWKHFRVINFHRSGVSMKIFERRKIPDLRYIFTNYGEVFSPVSPLT